MDAPIIKNETDDNFADAKERAKLVIARGEEIRKALSYNVHTSNLSAEVALLLMELVESFKNNGFGQIGRLADQDVEGRTRWELTDKKAKLLLRLADDEKAKQAENRKALEEIKRLDEVSR
ncbi:hypothetical protein [Sulfitobacter sp. 915]|uniref:hypothetical protein n=1 Tax=Sulfitobacter sp. 915 TaxID=3368558 RepID=UPI003745847B